MGGSGKLWGFIGPVLSVLRVIRNGAPAVDVKTDPGGAALINPEHTGSPGDDCPPLPGVDYLAGHGVQGTGRGVVSGYVDTKNAGIAEPGETRRVARDDDGVIVSTVRQYKDGKVLIENDNGSVELSGNGQYYFRGPIGNIRVQIDGTITLWNDDGSVQIAPNGKIDLVADELGTFTCYASGEIRASNPNGVFKLSSAGALFVDVDSYVQLNCTKFEVIEGGSTLKMDGGELTLNGAKLASDGDVWASIGVSLGLHFHEQGPGGDDGQTEGPSQP